jgi:hypothetical protein
MTYKTIGVCGAPYAGKTRTMFAIGKLTGSRPKVLTKELDRILQLTVKADNYEVNFYWAGGVIWYKDQVANNILSKSDAVIYLISSEPQAAQLQNEFFELYGNTASKLRKSWKEIPWIWVLNKIDLGKDIPSAIDIPVELKKTAIPTVAENHIGVDILWQRVLDLLNFSSV